MGVENSDEIARIDAEIAQLVLQKAQLKQISEPKSMPALTDWGCILLDILVAFHALFAVAYTVLLMWFLHEENRTLGFIFMLGLYVDLISLIFWTLLIRWCCTPVSPELPV